MPELPVYIVDIIGSAVANTNTVLRSDASSYLSVSDRNIQYIFGDQEEINKQLQLLSQGTESKITKYPLIALVMPFPETIGGEYLRVDIERMFFATVTGKDELFGTRYVNYFKPVLYPIYYEFFNQLSHFTVEGDPNTIYRKKTDVPRVVPSGSDGLTNDYVDAIVVSNFNFLINPQKIC